MNRSVRSRPPFPKPPRPTSSTTAAPTRSCSRSDGSGREARLIPAVVHVDGSSRPHTVTADANPRFFELLQAFERESGVPVLLNTSLNENEPIVESPDQALDCFLRTGMDMAVLGDTVIRRPTAVGDSTSAP